jgi:hypothetical protein
MKIIEFKTIKDFVDFINKNISNEKLIDLAAIIDYYNGSLGGCGCSRGKREQALNDIFNDKILNINEETVKEIKLLTDSNILIFYKNNNEILKQF